MSKCAQYLGVSVDRYISHPHSVLLFVIFHFGQEARVGGESDLFDTPDMGNPVNGNCGERQGTRPEAPPHKSGNQENHQHRQGDTSASSVARGKRGDASRV